MDILLQIGYWILTHGAHILSIVAIIGVPLWGWWQWRRRQFLSWVNIGLHTCEELRLGGSAKYRLLLRDLANVSVSDLTNGNAHAAKVLIAAAKRTRPNEPILRFDNEDLKIVMNMIRGYISGLFREGFLRRDFGLPCKCTWYLAFLVCEVKADIRRITIIVIQKDHVQERGIFDCMERRQSLGP